MRLITRLRDESGAMLVFIALMILAFLATFAIAVDIGLWLNTRAEAQRAADAAALAGASVYMEAGLGEAEAKVRAKDFASRNYLGRAMVDTSQVTVSVDEAAQRVRVTVRGSTNSLFSRFIGRTTLGVGATADARVMGGIAVKCVKPWALPDQWRDANADAHFDAGEHYQAFDPADPSNFDATGYGTPGDISGGNTSFGDEVTLVHTEPDGAVVPSIALPFAMPYDTLMDTSVCSNVPGGDTGAALYSKNICGCNQNDVVLDGSVEYDLMPSTTAMQGIVARNIGDIIEADPDATWSGDPEVPVAGSSMDYWMDSPRVFRVALFDPAQMLEYVPGGNNTVAFNNVALFFLEGTVGNGGNLQGVRGRFIGFPPPATRRGVTTSMPKILQLVK